jgi:hypothetical protein
MSQAGISDTEPIQDASDTAANREQARWSPSDTEATNQAVRHGSELTCQGRAGAVNQAVGAYVAAAGWLRSNITSMAADVDAALDLFL